MYVVAPLKPKFHRGYVDDVFNQRKKNVADILSFQKAQQL